MPQWTNEINQHMRIDNIASHFTNPINDNQGPCLDQHSIEGIKTVSNLRGQENENTKKRFM